ncbi:hypothetical protein D4R51_02405 [bacterium]|nr:MAG: hypothetical protein D4R51_02405 [bacterium]
MNPSFGKISESEMIIGTMFALGVSALCFIFDLFIIGMVVTPIIESFFTFGMWLFFKSKGDPHADKVGVNIAQYAANLIPFIPSIVVVFIVKVYIHNHPKIAGLTTQVAKMAIKA